MGLTVVGNESWLGGGVVLEETKFAYCLAMLAVSDWIDFWEDGKGAIIFFSPSVFIIMLFTLTYALNCKHA